MDKHLNIAHCVQDYAPGVGGMAEVARQLSERLVLNGHRVTVFTSFHSDRKSDMLNGVNIKSYKISGNSVIGIEGDTQSYIDAIVNGTFDVVTLFAAQQWSADLLLPVLKKINSKRVFVPTGFSALHFDDYAVYYQSMKGYLMDFDMNVFLSNSYQDIEFARNIGVENLTVIPNGASEEEFGSYSSIDFRLKYNLMNKKIILHVGSYTGSKGQLQAIKIFLKSNSHDAVLVLAGNNNHLLEGSFYKSPRLWSTFIKWKLSGKRILFLELSREETVAAFQQADLFLFPSQIECSPIVLFEAMASGLPFLSSDAGNAAELVDWSNQAGRIIPTQSKINNRIEVDIIEGAKMLSDMLYDSSALTAASKNGVEAWKNKFTWKKIAAQYEELYFSLCTSNE